MRDMCKWRRPPCQLLYIFVCMYFKLVNPANSRARWLLVFFLEIGIASGLYAYSQVVTSFYLI